MEEAVAAQIIEGPTVETVPVLTMPVAGEDEAAAAHGVGSDEEPVTRARGEVSLDHLAEEGKCLPVETSRMCSKGMSM
ncbi:MAG: hypothetical protein ACRDQW_10245 [Haloechinothrix sp.]